MDVKQQLLTELQTVEVGVMESYYKIHIMKKKCFRFFHRLCRETNLPRSERIGIVILVLYDNKFEIERSGGLIMVTKRWLALNLSRKEFAQYAKLRLGERK